MNNRTHYSNTNYSTLTKPFKYQAFRKRDFSVSTQNSDTSLNTSFSSEGKNEKKKLSRSNSTYLTYSKKNNGLEKHIDSSHMPVVKTAPKPVTMALKNPNSSMLHHHIIPTQSNDMHTTLRSTLNTSLADCASKFYSKEIKSLAHLDDKVKNKIATDIDLNIKKHFLTFIAKHPSLRPDISPLKPDIIKACMAYLKAIINATKLPYNKDIPKSIKKLFDPKESIQEQKCITEMVLNNGLSNDKLSYLRENYNEYKSLSNKLKKDLTDSKDPKATFWGTRDFLLLAWCYEHIHNTSFPYLNYLCNLDIDTFHDEFSPNFLEQSLSSQSLSELNDALTCQKLITILKKSTLFELLYNTEGNALIPDYNNYGDLLSDIQERLKKYREQYTLLCTTMVLSTIIIDDSTDIWQNYNLTNYMDLTLLKHTNLDSYNNNSKLPKLDELSRNIQSEFPHFSEIYNLFSRIWKETNQKLSNLVEPGTTLLNGDSLTQLQNAAFQFANSMYVSLLLNFVDPPNGIPESIKITLSQITELLRSINFETLNDLSTIDPEKNEKLQSLIYELAIDLNSPELSRKESFGLTDCPSPNPKDICFSFSFEFNEKPSKFTSIMENPLYTEKTLSANMQMDYFSVYSEAFITKILGKSHFLLQGTITKKIKAIIKLGQQIAADGNHISTFKRELDQNDLSNPIYMYIDTFLENEKKRINQETLDRVLKQLRLMIEPDNEKDPNSNIQTLLKLVSSHQQGLKSDYICNILRSKLEPDLDKADLDQFFTQIENTLSRPPQDFIDIMKAFKGIANEKNRSDRHKEKHILFVSVLNKLIEKLEITHSFYKHIADLFENINTIKEEINSLLKEDKTTPYDKYPGLEEHINSIYSLFFSYLLLKGSL